MNRYDADSSAFGENRVGTTKHYWHRNYAFAKQSDIEASVICEELAATRKYLSVGQELMEFGATDVRSSSVPGRLQQYE